MGGYDLHPSTLSLKNISKTLKMGINWGQGGNINLNGLGWH
jgi:hypothetical protein